MNHLEKRYRAAEKAYKHIDAFYTAACNLFDLRGQDTLYRSYDMFSYIHKTKITAAYVSRLHDRFLRISELRGKLFREFFEQFKGVK